MANFTTHLYGGAAVASIASLGMYSLGLADTRQAQFYFALGTIGGLLPDIDSDSSTPVRGFFTLLGVALAFVVSFAVVGKVPLAELGLVWLSIFCFVRFGVFEVFARLTVHRGVWHSWLAAFFVAAATTNLAFWSIRTPVLEAWLSGLFVAIGYVTHLCLDEIASVDLLNSRVKRSFGTALKPFSASSLSASGLMLIALLVLIYCAPSFDPVLVAANERGLLPNEFGAWIRDPSLWLADLRGFSNSMFRGDWVW